MRMLDLFCGAGGAAMGLHQAFPEADIGGVDIKPQPHYPFSLIVHDAMILMREFVGGNRAAFGGYKKAWVPDFIWASPPCQKYSVGTHWVRGKAAVKEHPNYIPELRDLLQRSGIPWVIENVPQAPLVNPITLCGSMFGLKCAKGYLKRHRIFESSFPLMSPTQCQHGDQAVSVSGHGAGGMFGYRKANAAEARELLQMPWASREGVREAIPPAYSRYIAEQWKAFGEADHDSTDGGQGPGVNTLGSRYIEEKIEDTE